jgi:hypothetical protein
MKRFAMLLILTLATTTAYAQRPMVRGPVIGRQEVHVPPTAVQPLPQPIYQAPPASNVDYISRAEFEAAKAQVKALLETQAAQQASQAQAEKTDSRLGALVQGLTDRVENVSANVGGLSEAVNGVKGVRGEYAEIKEKLDDDTPKYVLGLIVLLLLAKMAMQAHGGMKANLAAAGIDRVKDMLVDRYTRADHDALASAPKKQ